MKKKLLIVFLLFFLISAQLPIYAGSTRITTTWENDRLYESLNYSFFPDKDAVGEWEVYDYTDNVSVYNPSRPLWDMSEVHYRRNSIYEYGRITQHFKNNLKIKSLWTNGFIINKWSNTVPEYQVRQIDGTSYMFIEFKDDDYIKSGNMKGHYVFRKTSDTLKNDDTDLYNEIKKEYNTWSSVSADKRTLKTHMNVPIRIMWLIYTDGRLDGKQYKMTDSQQDLVQIVMNQFKAGVEKATDYNVQITNDHRFIHRTMDISEVQSEMGGSYIARDLAKPEMEQYAPAEQYHFVFTVSAIDTRPVRGVSNGNIWIEQGYANCYFMENDPYNASTAVHEFIHAFETDIHQGIFPEIEIPLRHSLIETFSGYEAYMEGGKLHDKAVAYDTSYHMRGIERDFFKAYMEYTDPLTNEIKYVGILPSMWKYFNAVRN